LQNDGALNFVQYFSGPLCMFVAVGCRVVSYLLSRMDHLWHSCWRIMNKMRK